MAVTRVGSAVGTNLQSTGGRPNKSQPPTPGNLLLVNYNSGELPGGWTRHVSTSQHNLLSHVADGSAADNPTFSTFAWIIWEEYSGVDPNNPVNGTTQSAGAWGVVLDITTTVPDSFMWAACYARNVPYGSPGGYGHGFTQSGVAFPGSDAMTTAYNQSSGVGLQEVEYNANTGGQLVYGGMLALSPAPVGPEYFTQAGKVVPTTQAGPIDLVSH